MTELCPDCGHVAGVSEDRCGAALERFLGAEPNQQYRALCKLRSRIARLEARLKEAADGNIRALAIVAAQVKVIELLEQTSGGGCGCPLCIRELSAAKVELERVKGDGQADR